MKSGLIAAILCSLLYTVTANSIADQIDARTTGDDDPDSLSLFRDALQATGMFEQVLGHAGRKLTVFAPTNSAIKASPQFQLYMKGIDEKPNPRWHHNLRAAVRQHVLDQQELSKADIFDLQKTKLQSLRDEIVINQLREEVQTATITEADISTSNGVLHVVNHVIKAKFFDQSFAQLELQSEYGPDHLNRVALTDVADFVGNRDELNVVLESGTTFVGCRIRAFNRLEEYLPRTINYSKNVTWGEFLNSSFTEETTRNFIEYSMIPKNYYREDIPNGFMELTVPKPNCGHMWVTKRNDQLCFNNGCVVATPNPREFVASNGVGYVVDKCQVCPGVAMLVDVAAQHTIYNLKDTAQFFRVSEWNSRDLRQSVGDGTDITLFASINTGWGFFNLEDVTRLASDKWKRHQWDLLRHMMVQGAHTYESLKERYDEEGPFNMTSLTNENILIGFDDTKQKVTVAGGEIFFPNIRGVDGLVHLSNGVPLPVSVTHTIYDIANENPEFSTQITYIDTVQLQNDMKRLLPLTALYAPNSEWEGKKTKIQSIAEKVLKSHMLKELWWCDTLRGMVGDQVFTLNEQAWNVSLNDANMPCFEAANPADGDDPGMACITKCDILARNGIVHEMDTMMLYETPETREPSPFDDPVPTPAAQNPAPRPPNPSGLYDDIPANDIQPVRPGKGQESGSMMVSVGLAVATLCLCLF